MSGILSVATHSQRFVVRGEVRVIGRTVVLRRDWCANIGCEPKSVRYAALQFVRLISRGARHLDCRLGVSFISGKKLSLLNFFSRKLFFRIGLFIGENMISTTYGVCGVCD